MGNSKSLWVIKNYPRIADDRISVCNLGIGNLGIRHLIKLLKTNTRKFDEENISHYKGK